MMHTGFWKRYFAHVIDGLFLGAVFYASLIVMLLLTEIETTWSYVVSAIGIVLLILCFPWLYYAMMESSKTRGTLGKMALGLVVVNKRYEGISFGRASARFWSKILSDIFYIGFLMIAFTEKKQGLHDLIAGTYVVDKRVLEYSEQYYMYQMSMQSRGSNSNEVTI